MHVAQSGKIESHSPLAVTQAHSLHKKYSDSKIMLLLSPYQAKKRVEESTQAELVLYVMSATRHCQMLVWGTVTNPKSTPLTGVQYVSMHCVLILVLGYVTLKRTTQVK